ncbi:MAG: sortase [Anaerolineae bacterium]
MDCSAVATHNLGVLHVSGQICKVFLTLVGCFDNVRAAVKVCCQPPRQPAGYTISIPSLNIDANVVTVYLAVFPEGVTWDVRRLRSNVGRLDGTSTFGQAGNTVLAGHSELSNHRAGVFYSIGSLPPGSEIAVNVNGADYRYSVIAVQSVSIYDLSVISPSSDERLTLIACDPSSYNSATGGYDRRLAVTAVRTG